jgi:hypothetical protein
VYSGLLIAVIILAFPLWESGGRRAIFWAFAPALLVAPVGYWFHNDGRPLQGLERELAVWAPPARQTEDKQSPGANPLQGDAADKQAQGSEPPALAPLAIAGLGLLGMFACARRFQPEAAPLPIE